MSKFTEVKARQPLINSNLLTTATDEELNRGIRTIQKELWVRKWLDRADLYREHGHFVYKETERLTIVAIDVGVGAPSLGWSKCFPSDTFDRRVSIAVATARAYGEPIPDYI